MILFVLNIIAAPAPEPKPAEQVVKSCRQQLVDVSATKGEEKMSEDKTTQPHWQEVVAQLDLTPLEPEGGFFKQTYFRPSPQEPAGSQRRPEATAILYMVTGSNFSAWHRVPHDEVFHFYSGLSAELIMIDKAGNLKSITLGANVASGEVPQFTVPAGTWQALRIHRPKSADSWSLMGTTMSPGFDFEEFELADRNALTQEFPDHEQIIKELTRD